MNAHPSNNPLPLHSQTSVKNIYIMSLIFIFYEDPMDIHWPSFTDCFHFVKDVQEAFGHKKPQSMKLPSQLLELFLSVDVLENYIFIFNFSLGHDVCMLCTRISLLTFNSKIAVQEVRSNASSSDDENLFKLVRMYI